MANCPRCGKENEVGARFCARCGINLESVAQPAEATGEVMYCYRHPKVVTVVRCGKCERPICPKCMVMSAAGQRCRDCARPTTKVTGRGLLYDLTVPFRGIGREPYKIYLFLIIASMLFGLVRGCTCGPRRADVVAPDDEPVPTKTSGTKF